MSELAYRHINFFEERDLGQVLNATFGFYKQNFARLLTILVTMAGVPAVLNIIFGILHEIELARYYYNDSHFVSEYSSFTYIGALIANYLTTVLVLTGTYAYMHLYHQKSNNNITLGEVWYKVYPHIMPMLGMLVVLTIIIGISTVLLIIPGIYMLTALSVATWAKYWDLDTTGDALSRSMQLVKGNWWRTFLILLVFGLMILGLVIITVVIPVMIIAMISLFTNDGIVQDESHTLILVISGIGQMLVFFFYSLVHVGLGFHYFSLVEAKEGTGLMDQIQAVNTADTEKLADEGDY